MFGKSFIGIGLIAVLVLPVSGQVKTPSETEIRENLAFLQTMSGSRNFLEDSPDVRSDPQSLNQFFTRSIYEKLKGNSLFGYRFDEGFQLQKRIIRLEVRTVPGTRAYGSPFSLTLQQVLKSAHFQVTNQAPQTLIVCLVGVEPRATSSSLPGAVVEACARNQRNRKACFIRLGMGHRQGLPAAFLQVAQTLVAEVSSKQEKTKP